VIFGTFVTLGYFVIMTKSYRSRQSSEAYRAYAEQCERHAAASTDSRIRSGYEASARQWRKLEAKAFSLRPTAAHKAGASDGSAEKSL
jgi:hypothetical protein